VQLTEAIKLVARLKAAFPRMTLDEPEMEVFVGELALLAEPLVLNQAIDRIIRTSERFPTIAEVRIQYRAYNEAARRPPALPEPPRGSIPEWVHVWRWQTTRTLTERQAARKGSRQPVAERPPVPMRDFPQVEHPGPDAYTIEEYEQIKADWVEVGSPTVSSTAEILAGVG
jgi:hypothetical protein